MKTLSEALFSKKNLGKDTKYSVGKSVYEFIENDFIKNPSYYCNDNQSVFLSIGEFHRKDNRSTDGCLIMKVDKSDTKVVSDLIVKIMKTHCNYQFIEDSMSSFYDKYLVVYFYNPGFVYSGTCFINRNNSYDIKCMKENEILKTYIFNHYSKEYGKILREFKKFGANPDNYA